MKKLKGFIGFIADLITISSAPWILIAGGVVTVVISFILKNGWILIIGLLFLSNVLTFILFWKQKSLLKKPIIIHSAKWGLLDIEKNTRDVTERVQELLKPKKIKNRTCYVIEKVNNAILCPNGEDPASGIKTKQLYVNYIYIDEVTIDENVDLILPRKI